MSRHGGGVNLRGGNSGGVNRGNHGGNSGRGRGGGGQTGSNSFVNKSNNVRFQTRNNTNYKSTYYDNPIVKLSKSLSSVLRHNAIEQGLKIQPDGYVKLDELRKLSRFRKTTFEEIQRVVKENDKQRFTLVERKSESGESIWWIRANQGHSLEIVQDLELNPITDSSEIPQVVHGTYLSRWEQIKLQGLSKMNRNHIHFAVGRFGDANVISGMRQSCDLFIYVNVPEAMTDNIKFFKSANGVILTEGINGTLDKKYFLKVIDKYDNVLYETSSKDNNNNNVNRNNVNKNDNVDDIKGANGNNNNKNVDENNSNSKYIDVNNNNANENNNKKGDNDNKGNKNASGNVNSGSTNESNDNKGNNAVWNGNNAKIMSPGSANDNKGNSVWDGNNTKIMSPGSTRNSAWDGNNTKVMNVNRTNENKGNNNVWNNKPKSMNDNRNKIVENNNNNVDTSSVNVNRNNDKNSDNNKRKNDNKDDDKGKKVFSYADVTKRQTRQT